MERRRKLFCELNPVCYEIALFKECKKKDLRDFFAGRRFARKKDKGNLEYIWKGDCKILLRKLLNVDMKLQEGKTENLRLAGLELDGLIIEPGEEFSFWNVVGRPTYKKGYKDGLYINTGKLGQGVGGGICAMGNLIHWLVLHTPLEVTEMHHHTDALFPDERRRVPFGTGVSICYKALDYRFKNNTNHRIQLRFWQDDTMQYGEIRSEVPLDTKYRIVEEDSHFAKDEDGVFYRNSKVYREIYDKNTNELLKKEMILNNHSKVMYDYNLIPKDQIKEP